MEIYDNQENGYIAVWLTKEEKSHYDRDKLTGLLLSKTNVTKCKIVYFFSGSEDLCRNTEGLLLANLKNV